MAVKSPQEQHPIINWFIHNPVTANLLMVGILFTGLYMIGFFGLFGMTSKLNLEAFSSLPTTTLTVVVSLNGSNPEDVEQGVTNKIEEALQGVSGIDKVTSVSMGDQARVYVKAVLGYDIDKLYGDVKQRVDGIGGLPKQVERVFVDKEERKFALFSASIYGDVGEDLLLQEARRLKRILLGDPHIGDIDLWGEKERQVSVNVSQHRLNEYRLTLDDVANAIKRASLNLSVGSIDAATGRLALRIKNQAHTQSDFDALTIRANADGSRLRLKDIAKVSVGFSETETFALYDGKPSVTLDLSSGLNANVIEADKSAQAVIRDFAKTLPEGLKVTVWNNNVVYVRDRIRLFTSNVLQGACWVFLLLTLFLNLRLAFWVAMGIPISLAGALVMMKVFAISINMFTLFGFILVLGIIVDDAIVIGESVYTFKKRLNNATDATIKGVSRVSTAATFGVLTTVAAFLPLTHISGDLGYVLAQTAIVIIFALLFSLVDSKLILPSHLYRVRVVTVEHKPRNPWGKLQSFIAHGIERMIERLYLPVLTWSIRHQFFVLLLFILMLVMAAALVISGVVKQSFFPNVESNHIQLRVDMNNNVSAAETAAIAKKATQALHQADKALMQEKGQTQSNLTSVFAASRSERSFSVYVGLAPSAIRKVSAQTIASRWNKLLGKIKEAESVTFDAAERFASHDVEINISADNAAANEAVSSRIAAALQSLSGVKQVASSQGIRQEVHIHLKPSAMIYGVTQTQLANTIRAAFYGVEAQRFQQGSDEIKVMVSYPEVERASLADLEHLPVRLNDGSAIAMGELATLSFVEVPKRIKHINSQVIRTVYADVDKTVTTSQKVVQALNKELIPELIAQYPVKISLSGESEAREASNDSLKIAMLVAVVAIYVLLAISLSSHFLPFVIMSAIPFGLVGAVLGHLILGKAVSMISLFGMVSLSGVVVNDSLLLVSTIKQYRREGMPLFDTIRLTGLRRFRPVILTSITTFAGLMPMLWETSLQARFIVPMAISLGFGILFATLITLILVPVLYLLGLRMHGLLFKAVETE